MENQHVEMVMLEHGNPVPSKNRSEVHPKNKMIKMDDFKLGSSPLAELNQY